MANHNISCKVENFPKNNWIIESERNRETKVEQKKTETQFWIRIHCEFSSVRQLNEWVLVWWKAQLQGIVNEKQLLTTYIHYI